MKKEAVFIILLFLVSFTFIRALSLPVRAVAGTIRVPQDFSTIQQAIDASESGGTILVGAGTYNENITVWKPLVINGESEDLAIIEQTNASAVCHVTANNVNISGFTLRGGSIGLWIDGCSCGSVTSTIVTNNEDGMWVTSSLGSVVTGNILADNLFMGLYLEASNSTSIDSSTIAGNTYGIYVQNSEYNTIHGNNISLNYAAGIEVISSNHNAVFHNLISSNSLAFYVEGANGNLIYENNLIDNLDQVWVEGTAPNSWDDGSHGNYWSNYIGADTNGDGIGDTPYPIDVNNQDRYPLMQPWTNIAISKITLSKNIVGQGYTSYAYVSVQNQGWNTETVNIILYANTTAVVQKQMALAGQGPVNVTLLWDSSGLSRGNYTISAYAEPVPGEMDTIDNHCTGSVITVTIPGDVTGEGSCDMQDISMMIEWFMTIPPNWNPTCDINNDLSIDMADISVAIDNFMKS